MNHPIDPKITEAFQKVRVARAACIQRVRGKKPKPVIDPQTKLPIDADFLKDEKFQKKQAEFEKKNEEY